MCVSTFSQLESEKNKLENLLSSNLLLRKDQLVQVNPHLLTVHITLAHTVWQEVEELTMGDHRQQLEMQTAELEHLCTNINTTRSRLEGTRSI